MYLLLGKGWKVLRILFSPLLNLSYAYANSEIHYQASIGPGISILHASPGVVISARAIIGSNLTLVGGNIIGIRNDKAGNLSIGNNCYLGANAVILGPVNLGDSTTIGACALVLNDFNGNGSLIGVPAKMASE
jgi:serine O-acetyltransferase